MNRLLITFLILIVGVLSGCDPGKASELNEALAGWQKLETENYSIQFPADWQLDESGRMGTSFMLFSQLVDASDDFNENVNLLTQDLSAQPMGLDEYVAISENQIKSLVTDVDFQRSDRKLKGKEEFHELAYTGKQGAFDLNFVQYYWVKENRATVLTFTAEQDQLKDYKEIGERIQNSFQLKETEK